MRGQAGRQGELRRSGMAGRDGTRITSTMQDDFPLTTTAILAHGSRVFGRSECVTWEGDRARHTSYRTIAENAQRLANALSRLGIGAGEPPATVGSKSPGRATGQLGTP